MWADDCPRIRSIRLTEWERPLRALITNKYGLVRVRWEDDNDGRRTWTARGNAVAVYEAEVAIAHIEQMCESMH